MIETLGRSLLRYPILFFALLLLPFSAASLYLFYRHASWKNLAEDTYTLAKRSAQNHALQKEISAYLSHNAHPSTAFLSHTLEPFPLLEKERSYLQTLTSHPAIETTKALPQILLRLEDNLFSFREGTIRSTKKLRETEELQKSPVLLSEKDLHRFLHLLEEDQTTPKPQTFFTHFSLHKKEGIGEGPFLEITTTFITRETYLP